MNAEGYAIGAPALALQRRVAGRAAGATALHTPRWSVVTREEGLFRRVLSSCEGARTRRNYDNGNDNDNHNDNGNDNDNDNDNDGGQTPAKFGSSAQ